MTEWKTYRLGDICKRVCSGGTPKSTESTYYDGDIPWLNTKEINFNRIYSTERCITQKGLDNSSAKWIDANCVIVAMYGATAAKVAINKIPLTTNQACCNLSIDKKIADYHYVYYWLCANYTELASLANGGAQQNLNAQQIKDFEISLPSLEEQRRIAGILGAIDDKIENNRRINSNLELQAQALFDKIFFDDKDVERNPLSDYANINPTRTLRQGVVARYIEMANLPTKGSFPSNWSYKSYGGGCKFANGDTIMARITPCLENGKTAYIDFLEEQEVAFGSTEYIVISAKSEYCPALFYFLARNKDFVDYAVGHMNGSSGRQRVSGVDIGSFPMPHITLEDSNKFAEIAMPIMDVIRNNSLENRQLATLRDTLLPKLMNGEIKL